MAVLEPLPLTRKKNRAECVETVHCCLRLRCFWSLCVAQNHFPGDSERPSAGQWLPIRGCGLSVHLVLQSTFVFRFGLERTAKDRNFFVPFKTFRYVFQGEPWRFFGGDRNSCSFIFAQVSTIHPFTEGLQVFFIRFGASWVQQELLLIKLHGPQTALLQTISVVIRCRGLTSQWSPPHHQMTPMTVYRNFWGPAFQPCTRWGPSMDHRHARLYLCFEIMHCEKICCNLKYEICYPKDRKRA